MTELKNLLYIKRGDILFFRGCYILVKKNSYQYVEGTTIYQNENVNTDIRFGDKVVITIVDLYYEDWYKLNKSEAQEIKLLVL